MKRLFVCVTLLAISAPTIRAQSVEYGHRPLRALFKEFCEGEQAVGRTPRVCRLRSQDESAISDAERFYTLRKLSELNALPKHIGDQLQAAMDGRSWTILRYSHELGRWRVLGGLERDLEWDTNGVPTLVRFPGQILAVVVEDINVLINRVDAGEVKEEDISQIASLETLFSLLGGGIAQVISVAASSSGELTLAVMPLGPKTSTSSEIMIDGPSSRPGAPAPAPPPPGRRSAPTTPAPPAPAPKPNAFPDDGVRILLAAVDRKRQVWSELRQAAEDVQGKLDTLARRRLDGQLVAQKAERQVTEPVWTATPETSVDQWRKSLQALRDASCRAAAFDRSIERRVAAYLQITSMKLPPEKGEPTPGVVLAATRAFRTTTDVSAPECARHDEQIRRELLSHLEASVTSIDVHATEQRANLNTLLTREAGRFDTGLALLRLLDKESEALKALRASLDKEGEALQAIAALEVFGQRFTDHFISGRLANWLFVPPRSDKQPWDKIGTHSVNVVQDSSFADKVSTTKPKSITPTYKVKSARAEMFGVESSVIYTNLRQPKWGVGKRMVSGPEGTMVEQTYLRRTGEDSRAGQVALLFDWRFMRATLPAASRQWWSRSLQPSLTIGTGLDTDTPSFYVGLGATIAKYLRLSGGWTWHRLDRLGPGLEEDVSLIASADDITTERQFQRGWYLSLGVGLEKLSLFGGSK